MYDLNMSHRKFVNTTKDKFQDQITMNQVMQTNRSKTNDKNMKTKTPKNNASKLDVL